MLRYLPGRLPYILLCLCLVLGVGFVGRAQAETPPDTAQPDGPFSQFQTSDYIGLGLTAIADSLDMYSNVTMINHEVAAAGTFSAPCAVSTEKPPCYNVISKGSGEGNPLITGLFGTHFPTALDYAAFGALELGVQTLVAWALPEKWRNGAWGVYVGVGAADSVLNGYHGGLTFRF